MKFWDNMFLSYVTLVTRILTAFEVELSIDSTIELEKSHYFGKNNN